MIISWYNPLFYLTTLPFIRHKHSRKPPSCLVSRPNSRYQLLPPAELCKQSRNGVTGTPGIQHCSFHLIPIVARLTETALNENFSWFNYTWPVRESNPRPLNLESLTLSTRPCALMFVLLSLDCKQRCSVLVAELRGVLLSRDKAPIYKSFSEVFTHINILL